MLSLIRSINCNQDTEDISGAVSTRSASTGASIKSLDLMFNELTFTFSMPTAHLSCAELTLAVCDSLSLGFLRVSSICQTC